LAFAKVGKTESPQGEGEEAREKLQVLKKQLPDVVAKWLLATGFRFLGDEADMIKVSICRQTSANEAKVIIVIDEKTPSMLIFHLRFYDHTWTTVGFQGTFQG